MKKKVLVIVANSFPFYCSIAKHIESEHIELGDNVDVFNYEKLFGGWPYNFSIKEKIYKFLFSNNFNKLFKGSNIIIKVYNKLLKNNYNLKLYLIGNGYLKKSLINYSIQNNILSKIIFKKKISQKKFFEVLKKSNIFVAPY